MARAIRMTTTGGPEVLEVVDVKVPAPGPGEVTVRHEAIGVNFIDVYRRTGLYAVPMPSGLGTEAAGVVEAVGEGVSFAIGDRVAYATGPVGAYAEARTLAAELVVRVPDGIDGATASPKPPGRSAPTPRRPPSPPRSWSACPTASTVPPPRRSSSRA